MRRSLRVGCLVAVGAACVTSLGHAQLALRLSVEQRGDAVLIGNTLAQNCAPELPAPQVGTVGNCGANDEDSGADVFWSLGTAGQGPPVANVSVTASEASSAALLTLPEGATVTHARLYWSAFAGAGDRTRATLSRVPGESLAVTAPAAVTAADNENTFYQASADVTAFVQAGGAGVYRLGGIDAADPVGLDDTSYYAAWWLLVFYSLASEPVRYLGLYDGFERVANGSTSVTLSGFEVPPGAVDARLGVVAFEGDGSSDGDQVRVGAAAPLAAADAVGRADNFFDGSRRGASGAALAVAGDLPETSGEPDSWSGLDLHTVDVASAFAPGQTSAEFLATTEEDRFFL
ncbi:MAG TPA: hypothetical protein VNN80_22675, partial [Polyangiaceae bacterium]|nr:hypothetical protein [Polyangiaceae bacterium]